MDFVLKQTEKHNEYFNYTKDIVFRFYPKSSRMYGFDEEKRPKSFSEVYKVYYSWAIIERSSFASTNVLFRLGCDECSALFGLGEYIREAIKNKCKKLSIPSHGQEGSIWEIEYYKGRKRPKWAFYPDRIQFSVWSNLTNKGFRFWLTVDEAAKFAEYIDRINHHMLENSEPA